MIERAYMGAKYTASLITVLLGFWLVSQGKVSADESIAWYSYEDAVRMGKDHNKKILLHFYADWCFYCKKMNAETFRNSDVISYVNKHFIAARIDIDRERLVASRHGIRAIPSTWFLTESGKSIDLLPGFVSADTMLSVLKQINAIPGKKITAD
jgi:thioredoxin-related protein